MTEREVLVLVIGVGIVMLIAAVAGSCAEGDALGMLLR